MGYVRVRTDDDVRILRTAAFKRQALLPSRNPQNLFAQSLYDRGKTQLIPVNPLYQIIDFGKKIARQRELLYVHVEFVPVEAKEFFASKVEAVMLEYFDAHFFCERVEFSPVVSADEKNVPVFRYERYF
jgi:hypothetical protein